MRELTKEDIKMEENENTCEGCSGFYLPLKLNCNSCIRSEYINHQNTVISDRFTPIVLAEEVSIQYENCNCVRDRKSLKIFKGLQL